MDVRDRYTVADMLATLIRVCIERSRPKAGRVVNGPERISRDVDPRVHANGLTLGFFIPGKRSNAASSPRSTESCGLTTIDPTGTSL